MKYLILISILTAILTILAIFILKLGWFLIFVFPVGFCISVLVTMNYWKGDKQKGLAVVALTYFGTIGTVWFTAVDQEKVIEYQMTWQIKAPSQGSFKEREIVLYYKESPQHYEGVYSDKLANHLQNSAAKELQVSMRVISDFGCPRGHSIQKIDEFTDKEFVDGYSGRNGNYSPETDPRPAAWWCHF